MTNLTFTSWRRSGIYDLANSTVGGRRRGVVPITVADRANPGDSVHGSVPFQIMSPADVGGFEPGAVAAVWPPHLAPDAEETKCPHVDFYALDLPWRYTPAPTPTAEKSEQLRPWIVLLVGTEEEINVASDGTAIVAATALNAHPLAQSYAWAHCDESAGRNVSRLLSRRDLLPGTDYVAVVVPAFDDAANDRWAPGQVAPAVLPAYHSWRFSTGAEGDFAMLAARLKPGFADPGLGRAPVKYERVSGAVLAIRGALAPIGGTDAPLPDDVADDFEQLLQPLSDPKGRPAITLPDYGSAWLDDTSVAAWSQRLRGDPRHRAIAGLGRWAGIRLQQEIADAAAAQAGAIDVAAARIRNLAAGLEGARVLWRRRLPADPYHRLVVFGAAFDRIVTGSGTISARLDASGRPLPAMLFSSASRRIFRHGPARARLAAAGALAPDALLKAANRCPPTPVRAPKGLPHADLLVPGVDQRLRVLQEHGPRVETVLAQFGKLDTSMLSEPVQKLVRERLQQLLNNALEGRPVAYGGLLALLALLGPGEQEPTDEGVRLLLGRMPNENLDEGDSLKHLAGSLLTEDRLPPCTPVNLTALAEGVADAIDPTVPAPFSVTQVLGTIGGLDAQTLTPPQAVPDIDLSFWRLLRDERPDILLPGADQLEPDSVVAVETNPTFVDAFLVGVNTQALAELRWRNVPMLSRWTPLRSFWDRIEGEVRARDIVQIADWADLSDLGAVGHQTDAAANTDLVLVFRSPVFHRFPGTLVYLLPPATDHGEPDWNVNPDFGAGGASLPIFQGALGGELTFFAFDVSPPAARRLWVVLEEVQSGYRFRNTEHPSWTAAERARFRDPAHSAEFADIALAEPTRVLIRGDVLVPEV